MVSRTDWLRVKLGDIAAEITVGHVGPMVGEYSTKGIPFLRSQNVKPFGLDLGEVVFVNEEFHCRLSKSILRPGDVVIVRTGNPGAAAVIPDSVPIANCADLVIVRPGPKLDSRFLMYYINAAAHHHVYAHTVGAVQQHFNVGSAKSLELTVPPLWEQRAIGRLLGCLDDKIELNRHMNGTIGAIAQGLFRSWFVEVDPVAAKAAGRRPFGMNAGLASLFPSEFIASDRGPVPRGWRLVPFSALVNILGGGTPRTSVPEYWGGDIPWFSVVDAPDVRDIFVIDTEKRITERGLKESAAQLLVEGSTIVTARGTVGKVALVGRPMAMNQSCYGLTGRGGLGPYFVYYATLELVEELLQRAHGSVFDTITRMTLESVLVPELPVKAAQAFDLEVGPLLLRIKANIIESRTLAEVRDLLLPDLLSGDLRAARAEKLVEQAV